MEYISRNSIILQVCIPFILLTLHNASASAVGDWLYDRYETELFGFVEARQGWRLQNDRYEKEESISEARLQLDLLKEFEQVTAKFKGDLVGDHTLCNCYYFI